MLDSGATCEVSNIPGCARYAHSVTRVNANIGSQGKGQSTASSERYELTGFAGEGAEIHLEKLYDSPDSRKCLINQNGLCRVLRNSYC